MYEARVVLSFIKAAFERLIAAKRKVLDEELLEGEEILELVARRRRHVKDIEEMERRLKSVDARLNNGDLGI